MRSSTGVTVIGVALLLGGCGSGNDSPPAVTGGGGGGASADADDFTHAVAQHAASGTVDQEPSDHPNHMAGTTPENTEPANL